ncbi:LEA type 2 family protein [Dysgonomonas sp. 25]|uniref:NDR1/HIN1-like protein n=1 Tax=Dysgonomonas sp. 25 TaxID=2302933 RepID=UPI0021071614|nr:LEA type 2 family protein [Dysgonomonas sp. 25]
MKVLRRIAAFLFVATLLVSCDAAQSLSGAYNMVNCKYSYNSLSNVSVSGMNLSNGLSLSSIPKLTSILTGTATSIPVDMTVNLDVNNPNASEAFLNGLQYIVTIDNLQLTSGSINERLSVSAGETKTMPINLQLDIAQYLKGDSKDTMVNIIKNIAGIGTEKSNVSIQIKPSFMIGSQQVVSPIYIPVNFTVGK